MGRRLNRNDSALCFDRYYRGCIWGLLPLHLHSFKKLVPQARRHSKYDTDEKPLKGFEEGGGRSEGKGPDRPRLQRTYSIHHLEPSSRYLDSLRSDPKHAIAVSKIADASEPEACVDLSDSSDQDASDHDAADESESSYEDFFDAFKIDKKLFIENTQKSDAEDPESMKSNRVVSLRRSGSFPLVNRSGRLTPSKLENKLADAWPSSSSSSSSFSSSSSSLSMLARSRSMDCKTRVGELEDLLAVERWKSSQSGDYASDVSRYKLSRTRRSRSLNSGSLEKYSQLFETSFGRDVKLGVSKSLRLSDEGGAGFNLAELKYLKKTRSVQEARWIEPSDCVEFSVVSEDEAATADPTMSDVSGVVGGASAAELNSSYSESGCVEDRDENESSGFRPSLELLIESEAAQTHLGAHSDSLLNSDSERTTAAKWNDSVRSTYLQASLKLTELELKNDLDHQLLSDLVNEALLGPYSGSDAYWLASLCSDRLKHPLPSSDHHVFKKVESTLQKLESFSLKASNTLDSLLAFDLAGDRSWMSLQADAESLSLALDEIIFDELMDELIYE
uniref:DUF4378 domain-containing protein n=1 Tax=Kalanchoe fedtschenkoi TaxID=63787 RepID=A0A7N0UJT2_KALFE